MSWVNDWKKKGITPQLSYKWLKTQVLCGHCNFNCCKTYGAFVAEDYEQTFLREKYRVDIKNVNPFIDKKCQFLNDTGCQFGNDRTKCCKIYPLALIRNILVVSQWCILHCPTPRKYAFDCETPEGKFRYIATQRYSHHFNIHPVIELDYLIEESPAVIETCKEGIILQTDEEFYQTCVDLINNQNKSKFEQQELI